MSGEADKEGLLCSSYPYIIKLMKIMGIDENDIEDLTEDVIVDAFNNLNKLDDPEAMPYWLRTIAKNKASKYFKKRNKRKEVSGLIKCEAGEIDLLESIEDELNVERVLQIAEEREVIRTLINDLPEISKRIIRMRFWGDYKHSEIADILNINESTEKSIYNRSLKRLKDGYMALYEKEDIRE